MTDSQSFAHLKQGAHKSVQARGVPRDTLPPGAVAAPVVKTLELELQRRRLLAPGPHGVFNPIWFLVETERNIFLWRTGRSLIEQDEFDFWVDLDALVEKRLGQLGRASGDNPFLNYLWGEGADSSVIAEENVRHEMEYLNSFRCALSQIVVHAHALCMAGDEIAREISGMSAKPIVLLPCMRRPIPGKS